jgi:hypothetical protein
METSIETLIGNLRAAVVQGNLQTATDIMTSLIRQRVVVDIVAEDSMQCSAHIIYSPGELNLQPRSKTKQADCSHKICKQCIAQVVFDDLRANGPDSVFPCPVCVRDGVDKPSHLFLEFHQPYKIGVLYLTPAQLATVVPAGGELRPGKSRMDGPCSFLNTTIANYTCDGSGEMTVFSNCHCKVCKKCQLAHLNAVANARLPKCPRENCKKVISFNDIAFFNDKALNEKFGGVYTRLSLACPSPGCSELFEGNGKGDETIVCPKGHTFQLSEFQGL